MIFTPRRSNSVTATVTGRGRRRRLDYRIRPRAGQTITFAERAGQVFHVLGVARGSHGTLGFTPADAPSRRREIVALISVSGVPSQTVVAGRYTAPALPRPGAVRHLRVVRRGRSMLVTWSAAEHAGRYAVIVGLSDGQRFALSAAGRRHGVTVQAPVRGLGARVTVQAISPDGTSGPARTARLAPAAGPGGVQGIGAIRTRAGVLVRWRPVRGAVRYLAAIVVGGPGGSAYVEVTGVPRLRPSIDLAGLRRGKVATITVKAMNAEAVLLPPGRGSYKPKPERRER
jgi:hypothetical protein